MVWLLLAILAVHTAALIALIALIRTVRDAVVSTQIITLPESIFPLEPSGNRFAKKKVEAAVLERP